MKQSYPIKRGTGNGERVDYWRNCIVEAHHSLLDSCVVVANYDEQRLLLAEESMTFIRILPQVTLCLTLAVTDE